MAFSASERPAALAEINVTPLVDVMLVLLIIFMVTAPMLSRPLELSLPQRTPPTQQLKPTIVDLDIAADGTLRLNQRATSIAELPTLLQDAMVSDPRTVLTVYASPEVDYQQVVAALGEVRGAGIKQISWRGE